MQIYENLCSYQFIILSLHEINNNLEFAMQVFTDKASIQNFLKDRGSVGFVPTMGALHEGHLSLIHKARQENEIVVVSIFVNPTQFNNQEDLIKYPRTLKQDLSLLEKENCDVVFTPSINEVYGSKIQAKKFDFDGLENEMEGKFRTGHFDGVGTIVKQLLEIIKPTNSYFGEKDFQQLQIIKKMVSKNNMPFHIIGCPIYRENDGLAMSSRNVRLNKEQRLIAPEIYRILKQVENKYKHNYSVKELTDYVKNKFENIDELELEYFEIASEKTLKGVDVINKEDNCRAFVAVYAGKVRLIDNIALH